MSTIRLIFDASAVVCALFFLRLLYVGRNRNKASLPLPPGPKGLPLIGNYLDIEAEMWEVARKWGQQYGPVVHISSFGMSYIFLNSYQAAVDLFEKRGSNYACRPRLSMIDLYLRSARRLLHQFFQPAAVNKYNDLQTQSTHRMLERLLDAPNNYLQLLRQSVGESILLVAYGYRALPKDDPFIARIEQCLESLMESLGNYLVNVFPVLRYLPSWFPGAGFQKIVKEGRELNRWMIREPHEMAKRIICNGTAVPSMTSKLMDAAMTDDGAIKDEALIAKVTGVSYAAGTDTSMSSLHTFLLAMLLYQEVQQRAQAELDQVVGKDVLPSLDDRPRLPYIEAVVKEILRWQPVTPLGVAHIVNENDEYNGYSISTGVTVLLNTWAIMRDPEEFPEPDKFVPERWVPSEGKRLPLDVYKVAFGVGRRICPGRYFAINTVFITIASMLSAFNITKTLSENGVPVTPRGQYKNLAFRHPEPFEYVLTPRSGKMESVIRQAGESAQ